MFGFFVGFRLLLGSLLGYSQQLWAPNFGNYPFEVQVEHGERSMCCAGEALVDLAPSWPTRRGGWGGAHLKGWVPGSRYCGAKKRGV